MRIPFQKILASIVVVLLVSQSTLGAVAESNFWAERRQATVKSQSNSTPQQWAGIPTSLLNQLPPLQRGEIFIPARNPSLRLKRGAPLLSRTQSLLQALPLTHCQIQEVNDSGNEQNAPVLLVQDVHMNGEAQSNIAVVLQGLIDAREVGMVGVEGAFTPFDFKPFRQFGNKEITRLVTADFLKKNLLAAPSYVGITSGVEPPLFVGVDDPAHHQANVDAYLKSSEIKEDTLNRINKTKQGLVESKKKYFSKGLAGFDDLQSLYHKGDIGLGAYVKNLASNAISKDSVLEKFLAAYEMESTLNFTQVERERRYVIETLAGRLSEKETSELLAHSLAYRMGRIGFGDYYNGIKSLCDRKDIHLGRTPAFEKYIRYVTLSDGIKMEPLMAAVKKIEEEIVGQLAKTPKEKELMAASRHLALTEKLVDFSLTPSEWEEFGNGDEKDASLASFVSFYEEADIRSHKMVENLLKIDPRDLLAPKALVVGGFHAPQVAKLLRDQKISYVIVSPRITKLDNAAGSAYLSAFAREKTPLDQLFQGEKLFLASTAVAVGTKSRATMGVAALLLTVLGVETAGIASADGVEQSFEAGGQIYKALYDPTRAQGPGVWFHDTVVERSINYSEQILAFVYLEENLALICVSLGGLSALMIFLIRFIFTRAHARFRSKPEPTLKQQLNQNDNGVKKNAAIVFKADESAKKRIYGQIKPKARMDGFSANFLEALGLPYKFSEQSISFLDYVLFETSKNIFLRNEGGSSDGVEPAHFNSVWVAAKYDSNKSNLVLNFASKGEIDPRDFSLEKIEKLTLYLRVLKNLLDGKLPIDDLSEHPEFSQYALGSIFLDKPKRAQWVQKYVQPAIDLLDEMEKKIKKPSLDRDEMEKNINKTPLDRQDIDRLIFAHLITMNVDGFKNHYFNYPDKPTKGIEKLTGMGVGLSTSYEKVRYLGGGLRIVTGKGWTNFIIEIPKKHLVEKEVVVNHMPASFTPQASLENSSLFVSGVLSIAMAFIFFWKKSKIEEKESPAIGRLKELIREVPVLMPVSILCVCRENINRSPNMANSIRGWAKINKMEDEIVVSSAGSEVTKPGRSTNDWVTGKYLGEKFEGLGAVTRAVTDEMLSQNDIIFVADERVMDSLRKQFPLHVKKMIFFAELSPNTYGGSRDMEDPHLQKRSIDIEIAQEKMAQNINTVIESRWVPLIKSRFLDPYFSEKYQVVKLGRFVRDIRNSALSGDNEDTMKLELLIKIMEAILKRTSIARGLPEFVYDRKAARLMFSDDELSSIIKEIEHDPRLIKRLLSKVGRKGKYEDIARLLNQSILKPFPLNLIVRFLKRSDSTSQAKPKPIDLNTVDQAIKTVLPVSLVGLVGGLVIMVAKGNPLSHGVGGLFFWGALSLPLYFYALKWMVSHFIRLREKKSGEVLAAAPPLQLYGRRAVPKSTADLIQYNSEGFFEINPALYLLLTSPKFFDRFTGHLVLLFASARIHESWIHARGRSNEFVAFSLGNALPVLVLVSLTFLSGLWVIPMTIFLVGKAWVNSRAYTPSDKAFLFGEKTATLTVGAIPLSISLDSQGTLEISSKKTTTRIKFPINDLRLGKRISIGRGSKNDIRLEADSKVFSRDVERKWEIKTQEEEPFYHSRSGLHDYMPAVISEWKKDPNRSKLRRFNPQWKHNEKPSPAKMLALQLEGIIQMPHRSGERSRAIADFLSPAEKISIGNAVPSSGSPLPAWKEIDTALQENLKENPVDRAKVADLTFVLKFVLSKQEYEDFVKIDQVDVRGAVSWADNLEQAKKFILDPKLGNKKVLGFNGEKHEYLNQDLLADEEVQNFIREGGQVEFVEGEGDMNLLELLDKARSAKMFLGEKDFKLNVFLREGLDLPQDFFDLDHDQQVALKNIAVVYFIWKSFAVPIDTSLLPDWHELRRRLIQA